MKFAEKYVPLTQITDDAYDCPFSDCEFFNLDEQTENTLRGMFEQVKKGVEANELHYKQ